jgi:hypothetical protein
MRTPLLALTLLAWPVDDQDDGIASRLKELKAAYKAKDSESAVRTFDALVQEFDALAPKQQEEVVKTVEQAFSSRRDAGDDVDQLFIGAAAALANMGDLGEKALVKALAVKHLRSRPEVLATIVEGLGQQCNPAMVDLLLEWLRPEKPLGIHWPVVAGAARSLSRYREAEPVVRKRVCGELVAVYADLDARFEAERAKAEPDPEVEVAFQRVEHPLLSALRALSGQLFENADDWRTWWGTAKDDEWTDGEAAPARSTGPESRRRAEAHR